MITLYKGLASVPSRFAKYTTAKPNLENFKWLNSDIEKSDFITIQGKPAAVCIYRDEEKTRGLSIPATLTDYNAGKFLANYLPCEFYGYHSTTFGSIEDQLLHNNGHLDKEKGRFYIDSKGIAFSYYQGSARSGVPVLLKVKSDTAPHWNDIKGTESSLCPHPYFLPKADKKITEVWWIVDRARDKYKIDRLDYAEKLKDANLYFSNTVLANWGALSQQEITRLFLQEVAHTQTKSTHPTYSQMSANDEREALLESAI